jgi:hypothetical protein
MNLFSFKSDLEAQAAAEWTAFIHHNLFNRLLRTAVSGLLGWLKRIMTLRVSPSAKPQTARQPQSRSRSSALR